MKEFKEISKDDVLNALKQGKEVKALILNSSSHLVKGGEHIREGVYPLNCRMAISDVARYEKEDNAAFFICESPDD
jgi:hypothetical protein